MAIHIITQNETTPPQVPQNWGSHFFQRACEQAKEECKAYMKGLDDQLLEGKPAGWQVVGKRRRTLMTRFREMSIERRLYRDRQGEAHFLLDEYLQLLPQQVATPEVEENVVGLAADVSFEQAAEHMQRMTTEQEYGVAVVGGCWGAGIES